MINPRVICDYDDNNLPPFNLSGSTDELDEDPFDELPYTVQFNNHAAQFNRTIGAALIFTLGVGVLTVAKTSVRLLEKLLS